MTSSVGAHNIIITGVTGFLGGEILAEMINRDLSSNVTCVARGPDPIAARRRIAARLMRSGVSEEGLASMRVIVGDLNELGWLGSIEGERATLINCAAETGFSNNPMVYRTNAIATMALYTEFVTRSSERRVVHFSSCAASGTICDSVLSEVDYPIGEMSQLTLYGRSKADLEMGISCSPFRHQIVTLRPSIIVGHTRFGTRPSASIFCAMRLFSELGMAPARPLDRLDIVPVDYVATATIGLLESGCHYGKRIHISAGRASETAFDLVSAISARDSKDMGRFEFERSDLEIRRAILAKFSYLERYKAHLLVSVARQYSKYARLNNVYDSDYIKELGFVPPRATTYIDKMMETSESECVSEQVMRDYSS
jgi:nucleoside-diphosphate-sugar epimerase